MINHLQRKLLLVTVTSLLSLFLGACSQSGADSSGSSGTQSTTAPNAATNSNTDMSKMEMPAKPSPAAGKDMATPSTPNQVMVENFSFQPGTLTVKAGTTVTWVNHDDEPHTVNENNKTFKSGTLDTDAKFSYKFTSPGTYSYFCSLHPRMTGQIIVK
ncbi:MAG TPA: cupredoxin family copper-binding protein [Pyrinomonadaceae bacterium]|nr:cupredoxin family copper-binding protein [Pyrinomonadaceae bacterium]